MKSLKLLYLLSISITIGSCSDLIEYSPFDADVENHEVNTTSINAINKLTEHTDTIKFALISDTHSYYDELADAVSSINSQEDLHFVVCSGDITESGLAWEYKQYHNLIKGLKYPIFTAIGNHDYLSNGYKVYKQMFGPSNISFYFHQYKFILFDDIVWENNNHPPDFEWLKTEVSIGNAQHSILIAHIPSWAEELTNVYSPTYGEIISNSNIMLCLHGHDHAFSQKDIASKKAIISGSVMHRKYSIISLYNNQFSVKQISY